MSKKIQVLGPGCAKCEKLAANVKKAVEELEMEVDYEKVTDIMQITSFGVMTTPALVIDGKVIFSGKVPDVAELKDMISA
ncbi:MAG: thioredoxin family protein [bacterium]|nr:thioredoxin family protein [bacterium]